MAKHASLPAAADPLGLAHAASGALLGVIVAAMAFLAALALAGGLAAGALARHWQAGAPGRISVEVPQPDTPAGGITRAAAVQAILLQADPAARRLTGQELDALLTPWLGTSLAGLGLPMPAVFTLHLGAPPTAALNASLQAAAPGTLIERDADWAGRLRALARAVSLAAAAMVGLVGAIAAGVVAVATRGAVAARQATILILHGLGAPDRLVAGRIARRMAWLAGAGAAGGCAAAVPAVFVLTQAAGQGTPPGLFWALPAVTALAWLIGWGAAWITVMGWFRRMD